jgi:hypothetical protein
LDRVAQVRRTAGEGRDRVVEETQQVVPPVVALPALDRDEHRREQGGHGHRQP